MDLASSLLCETRGVSAWYFKESALELPLTLSPEEWQRGARCYRPAHRRRYFQRRSVLRFVLGTVLGMEPLSVPIALGPFGKPTSLVPFSVSHTDSSTLIGVGCDGIDLAKITGTVDHDAVGALVFTQEERALMRRDEDFFRGWVRKEALLKADGRGFHAPWLTKQVWPEPETEVAEHFQLFDLPDPEPSFVAAAALYRPYPRQTRPSASI